MGFLYPAFLIALASLAIPLVIHLLRFKPSQTLRFSDIRFLQSAIAETSRIKSIRNWLLLLLRLLALAVLVFAFSEPFIKSINASDASLKENNRITVFLDQSLSMNLDDGDNTLFYRSIDKISRWLQALPESSQLIFVDRSGYFSRDMSKEAAIQYLSQIEPSLNSPVVDDIYRRWKSAEKESSLLIVSDLQKSGYEDLFKDSLAENIYFLPIQLEKELANLSLDSIWTDSPLIRSNISQLLTVRIKNHSSYPLKSRLQLKVDQKVQSFQQIEVSQNSTKDFEIEFIPGRSGTAIVEIDDEAYDYDNQLFFSWSSSKKSYIWIWDEGKTELAWSAIFDKESFLITEFNGTSLPSAEEVFNSDLIVLADWSSIESPVLKLIDEAVSKGSNVIIWPNSDGELPEFVKQNWNSTLSRDTGRFQAKIISKEHGIFKCVFSNLPDNADLPIDQERIRFTKDASFLPLIEYDDNMPQLIELSNADGNVYVFASSLSGQWGEWNSDPLVVPILLNSAWLKNDRLKLYLRSGSGTQNFIRFEKIDSDESVELKLNNESWIPPQRYSMNGKEVFTTPDLQEIGSYSAVYKSDTLGHLSLNVNKTESSTDFYSKEDFPSSLHDNWLSINDLNNTFKTQQQAALWPTFAWLALFFLVLESLLSRFVLASKRKA